MKFGQSLPVLFLILLSGCAFGPTPSRPPASPEATVSAPQPPLPPATTLAASVVPPAAIAPAATPTLLQGLPAVRQRFGLLNIPWPGHSPVALAALNGTVYSANQKTDNLSVIRDGSVKGIFETPHSPSVLLADQEHDRLYVGTSISQTVSVIQNDTVVVQQVGAPVTALTLSSGRLFVGLANKPIIKILDASSLNPIKSIQLREGFDIMGLAADTPRNRLYAAIYGHIVVLKLDTLEETGSLLAPGFFEALTVNPADGTVWVGIYDDKQSRGGVLAYNTAGQEVRRVLLDDDLRQPVIDDQGRLFIPSAFKNRVEVVDVKSGEVLARISVGLRPQAAAIDAAGRTLYVANQDSDSISVIDLNTLQVRATIPLAVRITALAADEQRGRVYVANASTDSIFVVEKGQAVGEFPAGHHPVDLARDPVTGRLFVASSADGVLEVVDEKSLSIGSSIPVTGSLTSVDVDAANRHLFAGSVMLNLDSLKPEGEYLARGYTIGLQTRAIRVRVDAARKLIYAVAPNGIPGSNARIIPFAFSESDLVNSKALPYSNGGNITALVVDPASGQVYSASTHPLGYTHTLIGWDSAGSKLFELPGGSSTTGLAVNPRTSHLFAAHAGTFRPYDTISPARDDTVQVLDTRTFGDVAWLDVPGDPGPMALLGSDLYVAGTEDGMLTVISDALSPAPPAPTATPTATVFPSPTPWPRPTGAAASNTPSPLPPPCAFQPPPPFAQRYPLLQSLLGCPSGTAEPASFALQVFKGGMMYDDLRNPTAQRIYVLFDDNTYLAVSDSWRETDNPDSCPSIGTVPGLIKPVRGFGRVWCSREDVRARLPGALSREQGVTLKVQQFERGAMWVQAEGNTVAIFDDGTWR